MSQAVRQRQARGRKATSLVLRLWSALLALLLAGSSLGQVAHFLLIQHAVCAEHGELVELHGSASEIDARAPQADNHGVQASAPENEAEHEHCQLLARKQQELALPQLEPSVLAPSPVSVSRLLVPTSDQARASLSALVLAPKTSPPAAAG
jgi:hypothetical protein